MRPTHKNRSRSRHRSSGSSSGSGGGNPLSRVYESNGPDVKVRGTAQTVADKYLQLGRDAQSSGDIVMAESYFQHAEHYLRIVTAAQAYNQQAQQQYRRPEEEFDDEDTEDPGEAIAELRGSQPQPAAAEPDGLGDQPALEPGERPPQQNQDYRQPRDYRDNRDRDNRGRDSRDRDGRDRDSRDARDQNRDYNREQGRDYNRDQNRDRYNRPPRWQDRRNEGQQGAGGEARQAQPPRNEEQPRIAEAQPAPVQAAAAPAVEESSQWEAPSFLRRPAPAPAPVVEEAPALAVTAAEEAPAAPAAPPKRRYERKPRKEVQAEQPEPAAPPPVIEPAAD